MCTKLCQLLKRIDAEAMQDQLFLHQFWSVKSKFEIQSAQVFNLLLNTKNSHDSAPFLN